MCVRTFVHVHVYVVWHNIVCFQSESESACTLVLVEKPLIVSLIMGVALP